MLDTTKLMGVFDVVNFRDRCHIIGTGSVGSSIAEMLARMGVPKITLWDFDKVESHNVVNSALYTCDIGRKKTDCVIEMIHKINDTCEVVVKEKWEGQMLNGYVFVCVDNIEIRKELIKINKANTFIKAIFDIRTGLYDAQCYAANWRKLEDIKQLENSMAFNHDEVVETRSACGAVLGVASTVRLATAAQIMNFVNFVNNNDSLKKTIFVDAKNLSVESF